MGQSEIREKKHEGMHCMRGFACKRNHERYTARAVLCESLEVEPVWLKNCMHEGRVFMRCMACAMIG